MIEKQSNLTLWTDGWSFCKTAPGTTIEEIEGRKETFVRVELPHDWLIYNTDNLYEDSFGWYRKTFVPEISEGERLQLRFDGVYMDSTLYINGKKVMDWKYGYTTFEADITEYLKEGMNELLLLVRHLAPNSRWYSGAGIYRNVWLKRCRKAYLPMDGTYAVIRPCGNEREKNHKFSAEFRTEIAGDTGRELEIEYVLRYDGAAKGGDTVLFRERVKAGKDAGKAVYRTFVENPKLWDVDDPNCYILRVSLFDGEEVLDFQEITVGFRSISFSPSEGLFLNGKRIRIHGVCEHHDLGCLGAAFREKALERKFKILRDMGVNGLRSAHNPPAPEFMELADRMGFLVLSESFDMWERSKTTYDYARFFKEWAHKDVVSWVRRDRNHPSLLLWAIGNEIYDTHVDAHGQEITGRLAEYVREQDPEGNARLTICSNYMPWEGAQKCADLIGIAGYNYGEKYYEKHHAEHPDWVIYGSETASVVQSRGIYHFPLSQSILADEDEQCSALGNSATSWGAESTEKVITDDRDTDFSFGMFIWSGFDYIGEPTPYHTKNSYFGQADTAGFPKDSYYIFQSQWTDAKEKPMVHLFPYWDFNPGQMVDVRAATNLPQVELFVNGRSLGRQQIDHARGRSLLGNWRVPYEPGSILAVAYDETGREVARQERHSFGDSAQICLKPDKTVMEADGEDVCFITVEMADADGRPVENAVDYVTVHVEGPARLLGMDNGDSTDYDPYKTNRRKLFSGKLLAVIGSTDRAGEIKVTAEGRGVGYASVSLKAEPSAKKVYKDVFEDCGKERETGGSRTPEEHIPVRKLELIRNGDSFSKDCRELEISAVVYPKEASPRLVWKVVNRAGIEVPIAKVEEIDESGAETENSAGTAKNCLEKKEYRAKITAKGDGDFLVRCMAQEPTGKISVISQLEFQAKGLGTAFLNPYGFISAGLYTERIGEIGNGNEKGISTARDGVSAVLYEGIDFGEYGSDEITVPVFALSGDEYSIEIWEGMPGKEGSSLLKKALYQKTPIWNVYQEETWKLPKRLKGVTSVAFLMRDQKVHIKGFSFRKQEKAFGLLYGAEADRVYGDAFQIRGNRVEEIGNNVTLEFEGMDFGGDGTDSLEINGWTPLAVNTIHIRFKPEDGSEVLSCTAEFAGENIEEYHTGIFRIPRITGRGRVDLVFLPGCRFNLESVRFRKVEE